MGWLYSSRWTTASAVRDHLRDQLREAGYTILDDATTKYGRNYWALITKEGMTPTIFLALINGSNKTEWGYKDMDESTGPTEKDCPLRLLDAAGPAPVPYGKTWREGVRAFHARRRAVALAVKTAKRGDLVWLEGRDVPYTVSGVWKRSLVGYRADGAGPFRLPTADIVKVSAPLTT